MNTGASSPLPAVGAPDRTGAWHTSERIVAALSRAEAYPHRPTSVEVHETHISWVFLAGQRAYKLKKPLVLPFLDYGTAERRRLMCREEVRLNRRLAPDVYLGVRGVVATPGGFELTADDDPRATDYVVEMRRYDERRTLASMLERGELNRGHIVALARVLAQFHAQARRVVVGDAAVLAVQRRFEQNLHELFTCAEQRGDLDRVLALERFAHAFIAAHARTFHGRGERGYVREGHGDLRAEHVLVGDDVRIVDCLEFDPELRELDVSDDLAFLVFDLAARGGERFGELLVRAYRDAGGDAGEDALISFYAAYRALVRAKIALVRMAQLPATTEPHGQESAHARDLIVLAERFAWRARLPLIIIVCGVPASGKSHLARALAQSSGLPHVSSDVTRKRLAGIGVTERAPSEAYGRRLNARTYGELARRAAQAVAAHGGAVVDASFRHLIDRQAFASALQVRAPLIFIECDAPRAVLAQRAAGRDRDPLRISDADLGVVLRERDVWEPLDEVPAGAHVALRTDRPLQEIVGDVLALLDRRLYDSQRA